MQPYLDAFRQFMDSEAFGLIGAALAAVLVLGGAWFLLRLLRIREVDRHVETGHREAERHVEAGHREEERHINAMNVIEELAAEGKMRRKAGKAGEPADPASPGKPR